MNDLLGLAASVRDLLLVVLGFGFIVFVHELGHFLAARWAGIRVLAFALGFGPAAVSFRKGMGWRRGSSEREYLARMNADAAGATTLEGTRATYHAVSPTEYRINWLPFGGYVKMLGQDDANPAAVSTAPDSYQSCKVWKRMIVISAGVVMNLILAATLFVGIFMYGLKTEPCKVGGVVPGMPASRATAIGEVVRPGLLPGDVVTSINGRKPNSFNDLILATAMTERGGVLKLTVERPNTKGVIDFAVVPEPGPVTGLQEIGLEPALSNQVLKVTGPSAVEQGRAILASRGLPGVDPGMKLSRIAGRPVESLSDANAAIRESRGETLEAVFEGENAKRVTVPIKPEAELQFGLIPNGPKSMVPMSHLLGLTPVLKVMPNPDSKRDRQGLKDDDIFARIGAVEFPSAADGVAEIRAHTGRQISVSVLRKQPDGSRTLVRIDPSPTVLSGGIIGFERSDTAEDSTMVSMPPARIVDARHPGQGAPPAATSLITRPGMRIAAVAGRDVSNFSELRTALREATKDAYSSSLRSATVRMTLEPARFSNAEPIAGDREQIDWILSSDDLAALHSLTWTSNLDSSVFEAERFTLKAESPLQALRMGLNETQRVMLSTYVTFARLFQGTVKVEHLKGPVGIAHLGTRVAERGTVWLLFFMALISVNLAVINFLPLPIVDGGQFLFLLVEQVRGKPVPLAIQNAATVAGLLLIGTVFVIVTFHDIANLFG